MHFSNSRQSTAFWDSNDFQYNKQLFENSSNTKDLLENIESALPPIFTRRFASKAMGELMSPKTLSNLDAKGEGPPKMKLGSKVGYERDSFILWLKGRLKSL